MWQEVESQLDHRLTLIEELHHQLTAIEDQRAEQVQSTAHRVSTILYTVQVRESLETYSSLLGGVAYCSPGELASLLEEKAHCVNMSSLANRQSAAQLCAGLSVGQCLGRASGPHTQHLIPEQLKEM